MDERGERSKSRRNSLVVLLAMEEREFLISLSGRQMNRGVANTASALLVGMWQLLAIIGALERYTTAELREMAEKFLRLLGSESNFKVVKELVQISGWVCRF